MVAQPWSDQADKDMWHVLIAPGETKLLSLEQLDDFFRLEVIDASTRVWQPGMTEWLPLSVVAGLEDEPVQAPRAPAPRAPAPPPRAPAPPPRAPAPPTRSAWPAPAAPAAPAAYAAAPYAAPAPAPRPAPGAATFGGWPPVATSAWPAQPGPAAPNLPPQGGRTLQGVAPAFRSPESIRPIVVSEPPPSLPRRSRFGNVLIGLAVFGAFAVTLYRNDVFRQVAKSAGQESTYLKIERSLGSPGFGTPRAIEELAQLTPKLEETVAAAPVVATVQAPTVSAPTAAPPPEAEKPPAASEEKTSAANDKPAEAVKTASESPSAAKPSSGSSKASLESMMAAQIGSRSKQRAKAERPAPQRPAPSRRERAREEPAEPAKNLGFKGSSNSFDPLNGSL